MIGYTFIAPVEGPDDSPGSHAPLSEFPEGASSSS